jgi:hypothetical protein
VSSRREQKEELRRAREERERGEANAARRRRRLGLMAAAGLALAAVVAIVVVALSGGDEGGGAQAGGTGAESFPSGGTVPAAQVTDLPQAVRASGCTETTSPSEGNSHLSNPGEKVKYKSNPPVTGDHYIEAPQEGAFGPGQSPPVEHLVHILEHGRVIFWYRPNAPAPVRANLKALYDEDPTQVALAPKPDMPFEVAASAWEGGDNGRSGEEGARGHLLGCRRMNDRVYDALRAFRDRYRGRGPEYVP